MIENTEILDVQFLVPARITLVVDGSEQIVPVSIDMANKLVYDNEGNESPLASSIFAWLDQEHTLPEDFFAASDDIYEKAQEVYEDLENKRQFADELGETDGG